MNPRAVLVAVQEALEVGDVAYAKAILTSALSEAPTSIRRGCRCECGLAFKWPGELYAHRLNCRQGEVAA